MIENLEYEKFLLLATDESMKKMIRDENKGTLTEKQLWSEYLKLDAKAPYSNYAQGYGRFGGNSNQMFILANEIREMEPENPAKVHVRNLVERVIGSEDYKKIGPTMDYFVFFISWSNFKSIQFFKKILDFLSNENIPEYYRIIVWNRIRYVVPKTEEFEELKKSISTLPIRQKTMMIHKYGGNPKTLIKKIIKKYEL